VIHVDPVDIPAKRSAVAETILRGLPEWFGIETAVDAYVRAVAELPTWVARVDDKPAGFVSLKLHGPSAAEVYVMGVRRELHRRGIGTALLAAVEEHLSRLGVHYLQAKTLGPSRPSRGYEATRRFYEARGFVPLEELHGLWENDNPCLLLVKRLSLGLEIIPIVGLPEIRDGDDLAALIAERAVLADDDVVVVTQKVVSKAEGRVVRLADVESSGRARELSGERDPRHTEVILREATRIVRSRPPLLIAETRHGFVCASAGVDASNAPEAGSVVLLPVDPDASARRLRDRLGKLTGRRVAVVVSDSFGRAWRQGTTDVAIGVAGLDPLHDLHGELDPVGYELHATTIAVADEIAGAAELVLGKLNRTPVAVARGLEPSGDGRAVDLVMPPERDLFR
jgi:coenzyme F420-0:L-glutamate ligase / coenzyme F420-1:gamma-L-glutamate ligase